ncbi:hypothetical protein [Phytohabitans kaempferiae]|uniref:Uncharacterized protein n=1 Tax=Phytohabitans kaempferiae TaxID=1620943 RepID=A0ABV6LUJ0_9ACTN
MDANYGISISGNARVTGSAMAAGPGAHAQSVSHGAASSLDDVRELMAGLVALVAEAERGGAGGTGLAAARAAQAELDRPAPDRHRLLELLRAVAAIAEPTSAVAASVAAITAAVTALG